MTGPHYVVGFLFSMPMTHVALIRKKRPAWQAGKLNGIGGHIELGESADEAMRREFAEEAGRAIDVWERFIELHYANPDGQEGVCHFFRACYADRNPHTMTDEEVKMWHIPHVLARDDTGPAIVRNLAWLIPFALGQNVREPVIVLEL